MSKNVYTRNSSEVVNIIMRKAEEAMFLIRRPGESGTKMYSMYYVHALSAGQMRAPLVLCRFWRRCKQRIARYRPTCWRIEGWIKHAPTAELKSALIETLTS